MWFIGIEGEQETSAPPPKKNLGSAPDEVVTLNHNSMVAQLSCLPIIL